MAFNVNIWGRSELGVKNHAESDKLGPQSRKFHFSPQNSKWRPILWIFGVWRVLKSLNVLICILYGGKIVP